MYYLAPNYPLLFAYWYYPVHLFQYSLEPIRCICNWHALRFWDPKYFYTCYPMLL